VRARTAELQVANAELRRLDHARVRFIADVSHELRTPLTILRGEAEVALRDRASGSKLYRETLRRIVDQAQDMARLIEDLMLLGRTESGDIRFHLKVLNLRDLVEEAVREAEILGQPKGIQVRADIVDAPQVRADRQRLKQVLLIVLDNAVKYSSREGTVDVRVHAEAGGAVICIRNSGAYLDADELPQLFARARRGRDAARQVAAGAGLGLAIAQSMTRKQGGDITIEKRDVDEVHVTLRLPLARSPQGGQRETRRLGADALA
jgi:signal transduction histidine kinase